MRVIVNPICCDECDLTVIEGILFELDNEQQNVSDEDGCFICKECLQKALDMLNE